MFCGSGSTVTLQSGLANGWATIMAFSIPLKIIVLKRTPMLPCTLEFSLCMFFKILSPSFRSG